MKKAMAIVLVIVLALSLFACGSNTTTSPSPKASASAPASAPASASAAASAPASASAKPSASASASAPASTAASQDTIPRLKFAYDVPANPASKTGGVLKIVNTAEGAAPIGIPWAQATLEGLLQAPLYEGLVLFRSNGEIQPLLATAWTIDTTNNEIKLTIRPNVTFNDGTKLTADVAGWNIMKQVQAKLMQRITGYRVDGESTLYLKYDVMTSSLISSLTIGLISKEAYEKKGEAWCKDNPSGTGPFMLKQYTPGQKLILVKNPTYWQKGKPYLDGVEFHFIRDAMTQNMAMQSTGPDGIDVLNLNSAEQVSMLKAAGSFQLITQQTGPVSLYPSSNVEKSPLAKLEVRQAIAYAIDRNAIVAARGFGICTPGLQGIPAGSLGHLPDSYNWSFNVAKAKELLKTAGYEKGFSTTLFVQPGVADKDTAVVIQKMLSTVGITAELQFPDSGGYAKLRSTGWDGLILGGFRLFSNPYTTFYLYFDKAQTFMVSVKRPDGWAAALDAAERAPKPDDALLQAVHKLYMTNVMNIPVYNMTDNWVMKQNVRDTGYGDYNTASATLANAWKG